MTVAAISKLRGMRKGISEFDSHPRYMKIKYNETAVIPLGYTKKEDSLILNVKHKNKYVLELLADFDLGLIHQCYYKNINSIDTTLLDNLNDALLDYDFKLNNKIKNKLKRIINKNEEINYNNYLKTFCR